jgi:hypothetical protein
METTSLIELALEKALVEHEQSILEIFENAEDLQNIKVFKNDSTDTVSWDKIKKELGL